MNKKKILFISSWFPSKSEPTNGNFVQRHAEAVSLLHDVEILHAIGDFSQSSTYVYDEKIINGLKTLIVYYKNTHNPIINFYRRMTAYKKGFEKMQFPELVHANVLHNSMVFAVYLKRTYKIPFVVTEHWTALRQINRRKTSGMIKFWARYIGNKADFILPVSFDLLKGLENLKINTAKTVIPNVVDTALFRHRNEIKNDFTFIHVSNLIPRKNSDKILAAAIALLKEGYRFKIQIGGDGDAATLKSLQDLVHQNSLAEHIEIFGMQKIDQIAERMQNSDCFILFSEDENQPCVIAESFASGLRVISTDVGGIKEFFPAEGGILLPKSNINLLKESMVKMLETPFTDQEKLVNFAEENFSVKSIATQFNKVYQKILP